MSYEPNTWANGDIITAQKLNHIEQGVSGVSSSYTPTTWANGDVITAQKLNNIEQGIANAGGGAGSAITVTLVSTTANGSFSFYGIVWDETLQTNVVPSLVSLGGSQWGNEYWNQGVMNTDLDFLLVADSMPFGANGGTLTVSGDAVIDGYDEEYGYNITITGDCTLTLA